MSVTSKISFGYYENRDDLLRQDLEREFDLVGCYNSSLLFDLAYRHGIEDGLIGVFNWYQSLSRLVWRKHHGTSKL